VAQSSPWHVQLWWNTPQTLLVCSLHPCANRILRWIRQRDEFNYECLIQRHPSRKKANIQPVGFKEWLRSIHLIREYFFNKEIRMPVLDSFRLPLTCQTKIILLAHEHILHYIDYINTVRVSYNVMPPAAAESYISCSKRPIPVLLFSKSRTRASQKSFHVYFPFYFARQWLFLPPLFGVCLPADIYNITIRNAFEAAAVSIGWSLYWFV
jgi:hypothetical protein